MADVRVGIVSWNTADLLDRCLASLPAALGDLDAEVVVVDNASTDDSPDRAEAHPGVRVIRNPTNRGYAKAMNQALAGSDAACLIALNPDTEPPPGALAALVDRLDQPGVGLVVPRLLNTDGSVQHSVHRFPMVSSALVLATVPFKLQRGRMARHWWLDGSRSHDEQADIDWAIGAVHAIRSEALGRRAPYSERWFMYVEDIELCWWMHEHGWRVRLEGDIDVPHVGNAAGAQAWGAGRAARYWGASYDFVAQSRGRIYVRCWAAVNVLAVLRHWARNRVGAALGGPRRLARLHTAAELRAVLPVHVRAMINGAPPPDTTGTTRGNAIP